MKLYSTLVSLDSYLIVEDSHVNNHPVEWKYGKGPYEAIEKFMKHNDEYFEIDKDKEMYGMTFNPNGYIRRIK